MAVPPHQLGGIVVAEHLHRGTVREHQLPVAVDDPDRLCQAVQDGAQRDRRVLVSNHRLLVMPMHHSPAPGGRPHHTTCARCSTRTSASTSGVAIPIALFHGRHDTICHAGWVECMAARIPGARITWFEHSAHAVMLEEPDRFSVGLGAFVG
jgi:pimeloyl-ACP methyl ester carboxylesterase